MKPSKEYGLPSMCKTYPPMAPPEQQNIQQTDLSELCRRVREILGIQITDQELKEKFNALCEQSYEENLGCRKTPEMYGGKPEDPLGFFWAVGLLPTLYPTKEKLASALKINLSNY